MSFLLFYFILLGGLVSDGEGCLCFWIVPSFFLFFYYSLSFWGDHSTMSLMFFGIIKYLLTVYSGIASFLSPRPWLLTSASPRSIVRVSGTINLLSSMSGYFVLSHIPMIWRHVKVVRQRTSRATSRHSLITTLWISVVIQHLVSDRRLSLISTENVHNVR
jgi:hypothetical protein